MTEWTADHVKAALVDAFEIDYDTGGRVGPKMYGSAMPEYLPDSRDLWWQVSSGSNRVGRMRAKVQRRSIKISRMEIVLLGHKDRNGNHIPNWLGGYLRDLSGPRNCLEAHAVNSAYWNLRGKSFDAKRFCKRVGWSYSTYRSRRDRGAAIIAFHLNELGMPTWW